MSVGWVRTDKVTGELLGVYTGSAEARLTYEETATVSVHDVPLDHPIFDKQREWSGLGGNLVQKAEVVISTNKPQIVADGIDEAAVTFVGLVAPISVSFGEGVNQIATPADPEIILTSDVPRQFVIEIDDKLHFAEPIFVEAQ